MDYYSHPAIKARIAEFLGTAPPSGSASCIFLIAGDEHQLNYLKARKVSELPACLEQDFEICRSLWDSVSLLVDLDIEYVNFDFPAEPYLHPHRTFALQDVVETTVEKQLLSFGIKPLHLLTGRGHHFIWRIRRDSKSFDQLRALGHPTQSVLSHYERTASAGGAKIDLALGAAYHGLGQAVEYFAAEVKRLSAASSTIPVELTAVEVGPGERGREMISLDISEFGDPLDSRSARVPYSRYLKPQQHKASLGKQFINNLSPIFEIPQHEMSVTEALKVMRDPEAVAELAERAAAFVPDGSAGMERLISSYTASALANFHPNRILQRVGHKRMIESTWNNSRRVPGSSWSTPTTSYFDHQECGGLSQCLCPSVGTRGTSPDSSSPNLSETTHGEKYGKAMIRRPVQNFIPGFLPGLCWRGTMISWISTAIPHASNARVTWLIVPTTCYGSGSPF